MVRSEKVVSHLFSIASPVAELGRSEMPRTDFENSPPPISGGVGGTVDNEPTLRSAGTFLTEGLRPGITLL
ncbi:hypothetical protein PoB_004086400 [Plakobranchus ocellatus]|uniref:Uncharacterized protein n=1 Tax=Plakobranchus ocellatus TaxID=259542 RepID=A0AAV4B2T4_9GAST|nr:hypothetical protein PoB_004086400 [Plakobranchus ocellatus]